MPEQPDGHRAREPRGSRRTSGRRRWGSLPGGAGVGIVAASAALGAAATIAHRAQPGQVLGVCIVAGSVIAALAVRPRAGRLIFPVPVLSYLIAALTAGIAYNRSTSKTELVIGAAQWIANGFLLMALATGLTIALVTVRWILRRRRAPAAPGWPGSADEISRRTREGRDKYGTTGNRRDLRGPGGWSDPGSPAVPRQPGSQPGQRPPGSDGPGQRNGPYPDQRYEPYSGQGNGQRTSQGTGQGNGQSPEQRPGQGYGQSPGQGSGQSPEQRPSPGYGQSPGQGSGQSAGQRNGPRPGQGHGQSPEQRPSPGYGQYAGPGSGQSPDRGNGLRPGQGYEQSSGQGYGQSSGQRTGQYPGQGSGQYPEQRTGSRSGQGSGQYPEQRTGLRSGQGSGQSPEQRTGRGHGQYSGQGSGESPDRRTGQRYGT